MAYIDIYNDDKADLTLDEDNIEIILKSVKHKLPGCDIETFKELLDKLKGLTIDDLDVYLTRIYADEDTIREAYEDYELGDDYESGKEDGYEEGYDAGINAFDKSMKEFKIVNWKILSKLEKYAYFNEKVDFSRDDAKDILDLINSI